jgi:hypothetical protein
MRRSIIITAALALAILLAQAGTASAIGWGPRLGLTMDPDQVHFGAHLDAGYLAGQLRFQPAFEMGFGDNRDLAAFNFDLLYLFNDNLGSWGPYLGGGPALNMVDNGRSDWDAGLNAVGGIERGLSSGGRFLTELRLGLIDAPDLKWTVGWTFQH